MFSGIIETAAKVVKLEKEKDNLHITMRCSFVDELKIDQSISHNGVCLTVVKKDKETYTSLPMRDRCYLGSDRSCAIASSEIAKV